MAIKAINKSRLGILLYEVNTECGLNYCQQVLRKKEKKEREANQGTGS